MKTIIVAVFFAVILHAVGADAFSTPGFFNPYGVVVDAKTNFIYVSNVNGSLDGKDDNGFISRLKGDGTVDLLRFIDGQSKDITLNAPKGMAIRGTTIYVADVDKLHAFDLNSAKQLFDVNFGNLPVQHFYDITLGADDTLYLTDGPANVIYKIDIAKQHEVTTLASGENLAGPHGICWSPSQQMLVVGSWMKGMIIAFDRTGKPQPLPLVFVRSPEGIAADELGNTYVASNVLSAVYRLALNFALNSFGLGLSSPTGLAYQSSGKQVIVTLFNTGVVQSIPIPQT